MGGEQVGKSKEPSRILSAVAATADIRGATPETSDAEAGVGDGGCSRERQAACFTLLNMTLASATHVTNESEVVPNFDDESLDKICR